MFKGEFIDTLAKRENCTKKVAREMIDGVFQIIKEAAKRDGFVQLTGIGTFVYREYPERERINPKTKESITVEASNGIKFKPGKDFINI